MTDEEFVSDVKRHWTHWANHLGLENWWFSFKLKKSKEWLMQWQPHEGGYLRGLVFVNASTQDLVYCNDLRRNVLHEVFHVCFTFQDNFIRDSLGTPAWNTYLAMAEANMDELTSIFLRMHDAQPCPLEAA